MKLPMLFLLTRRINAHMHMLNARPTDLSESQNDEKNLFLVGAVITQVFVT